MTYAVFAHNGDVLLSGPYATQEDADADTAYFTDKHPDADAGEICPGCGRRAFDSCPGDGDGDNN
ncbi:hypothetical protein [Streptomyces sp. NBC_00239]|uniref:hypothetical protein n=1 Tax=Streptomyces sp. NBC_00239 TaxID=2903640 RepID=UPI002E2A380F|nr:hypothetical protein [Streptomyces sp. NBC_00239]